MPSANLRFQRVSVIVRLLHAVDVNTNSGVRNTRGEQECSVGDELLLGARTLSTLPTPRLFCAYCLAICPLISPPPFALVCTFTYALPARSSTSTESNVIRLGVGSMPSARVPLIAGPAFGPKKRLTMTAAFTAGSAGP